MYYNDKKNKNEVAEKDKSRFPVIEPAVDVTSLGYS